MTAGGYRYEELSYEDGHRHRGGLCYELGHTGDYWYYEPDSPFTVDGIRYDRSADPGVCTVRLMIDYIAEADDLALLDGAAYMFCSLPPTDQELDRWTRHGQLPLLVNTGGRA